MPESLQHTLIRASAGSGKTFQLANRYIALLLLQLASGKLGPERLVAVTFTRKGAGEFAERILTRLARAAASPEACAKLAGDLQRLVEGDEQHPGLAPGVKLGITPDRIRQALAAVVDQFDRLVLGTIDSFMARSVQTLAFELGLGGFQILEEPAAEVARKELLGAVFQQAQERDLEVFYQTIKRATLKSSSSLRREVDQFVRAYHQLLQALPDVQAWGGPAFWGRDTPTAEGDWRPAAQALRDEVAGMEFGHRTLNNSFDKTLEWLAKRDPETATSKPATWLKADGLLLQLWAQWPAQGAWEFSYQRRTRTFPTALLARLRPILDQWLAAEQRALSGKTQALYELVRDYEQVYDRQARRQGRLAFADLPVLLGSAEGTEAMEHLGFRWFQQFDHWLLDEFQDTSRLQWKVLKPWLDETLQDDSGTKSVFVVGDAKQSIYGWRGGEPRLFDELVAGYAPAFVEQVMAESWRSRPAVLALADALCNPAANAALNDPDLFSPQALERWQFAPHTCSGERAEKPGYAAILRTPTDDQATDPGAAANAEGEEGGDKMSAQARVIKSVLEGLDPLGKGLSCAILTRTNAHGQALAQWLRAHGVPRVMVEGDSTLADQSPVIAALADALRWLRTPADSLAAGHVQLSPLWEVLRAPVKGDDVKPGAVWRHWRLRITESGAAQVTRDWCAALGGQFTEPYHTHCLRQVDQVAHRLGATLTLGDWLTVLEQLTVRETATAGAIHVMTIHKAKGLGFDVVFLPDLDLGRNPSESVLLRKDADGIPTGCLASPPGWLCDWVPSFKELRDAQQADQDLEALCVLYVALTRAREATFLVLQGQPPRGGSRTRDWIAGALAPDGVLPAGTPSPWGTGSLLWENGQCDLAAPATHTPAAPFQVRPDLDLGTPAPRRQRRKPSDTGHEGFEPTAESGGGRAFGKAVHAVFEQIEWWQPGQALEGPDDAVQTVRDCLAAPGIAKLFTRANPSDEALRELPVEYVEGNTWWSGVLDRLVLRRDPAGSVKQALLIDFKTDAVTDPAALQKLYAPQLTLYTRAVAAALGLKPNQVQVLLVSTRLRQTVPI